MKETPVGVWMWLALIIIVNATWISMDLWLHANGYEYLTTEFREGLRNELWGPCLCFLTAGTAAAFIWHMWTK